MGKHIADSRAQITTPGERARNSFDYRTGRRPAGLMLAAIVLLAPTSAPAGPFTAVEGDFQQQTLPLLKQFCLDCHSTAAKEGELDLERFSAFADVRHDPKAWQKVAEMLGNREMPPEDSPQPSAAQRDQLLGWVRRYLDTEARASAGDPGPVVLRRLNNAEYTYTVRDLTGAELNPAAEFPADSAAGEGFTNTGNALVMSPALVTKYLDAAKDIASHAVLVPDGMRFSAGNTRRDWTNEILYEIRSIYFRHTSRLGDANALNSWSVADPTKLTEHDGRVDLESYFAALMRNRERLLDDPNAAAEIAAKERLNPKYTRLIAEMLVAEQPASQLLEHVRKRWRAAGAGEAASIAAEVRA